QQGTAFAQGAGQPPEVVPVCTSHLPSMRAVALQQKFVGGEAIEHQAPEQPPHPPSAVEVLGKHRKAVAEVQVSLARTAIAQCTATHVVYGACAGIAYAPPPAP